MCLSNPNNSLDPRPASLPSVESDGVFSGAYQAVGLAGSTRVNADYFRLKLCCPAKNQSRYKSHRAMKSPANIGVHRISLYANVLLNYRHFVVTYLQNNPQALFWGLYEEKLLGLHIM